MTTEDPKYKVIAAISTALIVALMATYELRKQDSIDNRLQSERQKMEEIRYGKLQLEKEHRKAKRLIEILESKNRALEKTKATSLKK